MDVCMSTKVYEYTYKFIYTHMCTVWINIHFGATGMFVMMMQSKRKCLHRCVLLV